MGLTVKPAKQPTRSPDPKQQKLKDKLWVPVKMMSANLPNLTSNFKELFESMEEAKLEINRWKQPGNNINLAIFRFETLHDVLDKISESVANFTFKIQRERERLEH